MAVVAVAVAVTMLVLPGCCALDPGLLQQLEDRSESHWVALLGEERLALCRFRLHNNLETICGKSLYRRSTMPTGRSARRRRSARTPPLPPFCLAKHDDDGEGDQGEEGDREKGVSSGVSVSLPSIRTEISPSAPDTGQPGTHTRLPFLSVQQASFMLTTWVSPGGGSLRRRRRHASSITAECCTPAGCTWEEYAEYCPSSARHRLPNHNLL